MINNNNKKVDKFVEAITAYAEEQSRKIHDEVEAFKAERMAQAEQQVLQEAYNLIHEEREEVNNQLKKEFAQREFARRGELIRRRQAIIDTVFEEARRRLLDYCSTPAYEDLLRASMKEMTQLIPADGTVYYLSERDRERESALQDLCPAGSRVDFSGDIALGGIRGMNTQAGILVDDTLDSKLEQQRDWFIQSMGLSVKPA